jgi:protein-S-isoprenylcysteine O-methyltransferase Ste14
MISGVVLVLMGEASFFGSTNLLLWTTFFFAIQNMFIKFHEEPDLFQRFGRRYEVYYNHVPMWIPRIKQFDLDEEVKNDTKVR